MFRIAFTALLLGSLGAGALALLRLVGAAGLTLEHRVGQLVQDDLDGPHRVVIAGDGQVDQLGVGDHRALDRLAAA